MFLFNDTATTEIYTLSLHDALPISGDPETGAYWRGLNRPFKTTSAISLRLIARLSASRNSGVANSLARSEEHTSELQSRQFLVRRLLLDNIYTTLNQTTAATGRISS